MSIPAPSYKRVLDWFKDKNIKQACPSCGEEFEIKDVHFSTPNDNPDAPPSIILIVCPNCGNKREYESRLMGFQWKTK